MIKQLLLLFTLSYQLTSVSQEVQFDIVWKGKNVGNIKAIKSSAKETTEYTITADAKINILLSYNIENYTYCKLEKRKLTKSIATYKVNGKLKENTDIAEGDDAYICNTCKKPNLAYASIGYTTSMMYFIEPAKSGSVFSERFGEYATLTKVADHEFNLELPDGKINNYYYEDGKLVKIHINRALYSMDFLRK